VFRYWKTKSGVLGAILFLSLILVNNHSYAQTEQEALLLIDNASEKLKEALSLLEEIPITNSDSKLLTSEVDSALQLIQEAKSKTIENEYSTAIQKANEAITKLDTIIEQLEEILKNNKQKNNILFSLLGVFLALFTVIFLYLYLTKIYPWYKMKKVENYERLEIVYGSEDVLKNGEKNV
jgi:hypothetical protein